MSEPSVLTAEQWREKCHDFYKVIKFYQKRSEDLFNGKREEAEAELAGILAKEEECRKVYDKEKHRDVTFTKGPDGKFYMIACAVI